MHAARTIHLPTGMAITLACRTPALAPVTLPLTLRDGHGGAPVLRAVAGDAIIIAVHNAGAAAETVRCAALEAELSMAGGKRARLRLPPPATGRYEFTCGCGAVRAVLLVEDAG